MIELVSAPGECNEMQQKATLLGCFEIGSRVLLRVVEVLLSTRILSISQCGDISRIVKMEIRSQVPNAGLVFRSHLERYDKYVNVKNFSANDRIVRDSSNQLSRRNAIEIWDFVEAGVK